jgi:hypothetical protein
VSLFFFELAAVNICTKPLSPAKVKPPVAPRRANSAIAVTGLTQRAPNVRLITLKHGLLWEPWRGRREVRREFDLDARLTP